MAENRAELMFPFGGLNDAEALTDQPNATTTEAVNVRPFDPVTGRRRGAQRSGLSKFSTAVLSGSVQSLVPVSYAENRLKYSLLDTPTQEWAVTTPAVGTASAIAVDSKGFVYAFDGSASIVKYSAAGVKIATLAVAVTVGGTKARRIIIDEFGDVYGGFSGSGAGLVFKWRENEDGTYTQRWTLEVPGTFRDMSIQNDVLYVALDTGEYQVLFAGSEIRAYSGLLGEYAPEPIWDKSVPHPVHALDIASSGVIYFASGPNPLRGDDIDSDTSSYDEGQVDWTPMRLTNIASRLHYWLDASYIHEITSIQHEDYLTAANIPSITQRVDLPYSEGYGDVVSDTTERPTTGGANTFAVIRQGYAGGGLGGGNFVVELARYRRYGPQFLANTWGSRPTFRFSQKALYENNFHYGGTMATGPMYVQEPGTVLCTRNNSLHDAAFNDVKLSAADALEKNRAGIPCAEDGKYIFAMCGRIDFNDSPARSIVWCIDDKGEIDDTDGNHSLIAMMVNADQGASTNPQVAATGNITVFIKGAKFTSDADLSDGDGQNTTMTWRPIDLSALDADGRFILTIVMDGSGTRKGAIRINGRALDSFTVTDTAKFKLEGSYLQRADSNTPPEYVPAGRLILGGPTNGHNFAPLDGLDDSAHDPTVYPYVAPNGTGWYNDVNDGQPPFVGDRDSSFFGGNDTGTGAYAVGGKAGHFSGDISEIITVLADSTGGAFNNNSVGLVPYKTANADGSGGSANLTAERGRASCNSITGSTDVEDIEGYLAWKWGISTVLPSGTTDTYGMRDGHPWKAGPPSSDSTTVVGFDNTAYTNAITSKQGIIGKMSSNGDGVWAIAGGGMGYGLVATDDNTVYTAGPTNADAVNPSTDEQEPLVQTRKLIDQNLTCSADPADGAWTFDRVVAGDELATTEAARYPKLSVDSDGNLYWPLANSIKANHVRRLANDDGSLDWEYSISSEAMVFGVALPPTTPTYDDEDLTGPEFVYLCSDNGEVDGTTDLTLPQLHKIKQVLAEQNIEAGTSARTVRLAAVSNGTISDLTTTTSRAITGGGDALLSDSAFISGVSAFNKAYFTDGLTYKVYDPDADTVSDWAAEKGEIPPRAKVVSFWRGRMILARDPEDPQDWHMSALGDPDNWDKNPPVLVATMAVSGNNSRCGITPDIVNTLIPYNDDLLLFGCDSNIYRLTGDPMAGGQMDTVSTVTGIAFGEAWCKDPEGTVYFFGSRGGVFAMSPQGEIVSISDKTIERRLQDIDLERYRIKLVWNDREQGINVFQVPYYHDGILLTSWFWDRRHNAWFEDELTDASKQCSATAIMDGDAYNDRVLLIGAEDGYVRKYDSAAAGDDGDRINSKVLFGPLVQEESGMNLRYCKLGVELATDQNGVEYDWYVSRAVDTKGDPVRSGALNSGPNAYPGGMFTGASSWVRLRNGASAERWALEALSLGVYPAGRKRL